MSNATDFITENGVLKKYTGKGGDVVIPGSVTSIGDDAFSDCSSLTIHAPAGSYAETYANANSIRFAAE